MQDCQATNLTLAPSRSGTSCTQFTTKIMSRAGAGQPIPVAISGRYPFEYCRPCGDESGPKRESSKRASAEAPGVTGCTGLQPIPRTAGGVLLLLAGALRRQPTLVFSVVLLSVAVSCTAQSAVAEAAGEAIANGSGVWASPIPLRQRGALFGPFEQPESSDFGCQQTPVVLSASIYRTNSAAQEVGMASFSATVHSGLGLSRAELVGLVC